MWGALQSFCRNRIGISYIPPGTPWNNGFIESFNSRMRRECLGRNHWTHLLEARVVIGDFKHEHNTRHRHSSLDESPGAARCITPQSLSKRVLKPSRKLPADFFTDHRPGRGPPVAAHRSDRGRCDRLQACAPATP
ncbi:integrase core domain-containing protein [Mycobacteroides salmoniphilum]|uniref:integrase core domain-containing protein n=1 Tax=Mycobacteroides salmoniphilum TaxID=404941 RepID=UPI00099273BE